MIIKEPKSALDIDLDYYRKFNDDLATLNNEQLLNHYTQYGRAEGRSNHMCRRDFVFSIPRNKILEIGPFTNPSLIGNHVKYFDVLDFPELVKRAKKHSYPVTHKFKIDYVSSNGDLGIIREKFSPVFSSHCVEHQVDLIKHINQVENLLENTGKYYLIIPDKRYCFDYFIPECSVADVPGAALLRSSERHHPANILKHRAMITHNDPVQHWSGLHGDIDYNQNLKLTNALTEIRNNDGYIDVHAWQFTPESFKLIINTLFSILAIKLKIESVSMTPFNANKFCAILSK